MLVINFLWVSRTRDICQGYQLVDLLKVFNVIRGGINVGGNALFYFMFGVSMHVHLS